MAKTIKEIADELGVSKTAVSKQIANLGLRSSLRKNGNQFAIENQQEKLIKMAFQKKRQQEIKCTLCQGHYDFFLFRFLFYICLLCRGIKVMPLIDCFHLLL